MNCRNRNAAALALLAIVVGGCNRGPKLYQVTGTVTLNGKPVPDAAIMFYKGISGENAFKFEFPRK